MGSWLCCIWFGLYYEKQFEAFQGFPDYFYEDISGIPKVYNGKLNLKLKDEKQFVGYSGELNGLSSLLLKKNNLHIDIIFDPDNKLEIFNPEGNQDKAKVHDIILESAISTILDCEDSVATVDAEDKILAYKNWLGLMKGDLKIEFQKRVHKKIAVHDLVSVFYNIHI